MFALRGISVSFSVFVIVYGVLSLAVAVSWSKIRLRIGGFATRRLADSLFALRVFPLVGAATVTLALVVPSFLLLEPRAIDEPLGTIPLALGSCGVLLGILGAVNAATALRRAARGIAACTRGAQLVESAASVPVLRITRPVPAMTVAGISRPKVLLSEAAEFLLTAGELRTALNHEVAHVARRDNLKKLVLRLVPFPAMRGLEAAWLEAIEMAADDDAVSDAHEALDLAAALIKLARLGPPETPLDLSAALVHNPVSAVNARVERLIAWSAERRETSRKRSPLYSLAAALVTLSVLALTYSQLLVQVHAATEWLVR